jgi:hypothetical protein
VPPSCDVGRSVGRVVRAQKAQSGRLDQALVLALRGEHEKTQRAAHRQLFVGAEARDDRGVGVEDASAGFDDARPVGERRPAIAKRRDRIDAQHGVEAGVRGIVGFGADLEHPRRGRRGEQGGELAPFLGLTSSRRRRNRPRPSPDRVRGA